LLWIKLIGWISLFIYLTQLTKPGQEVEILKAVGETALKKLSTEKI